MERRPGHPGRAAGRGGAVPPFSLFVEEHRRDVYRFLLAMVGPAEVDDCFQETFLAALRGYGRLRDGENLRGWILTIAGRKAVDAARARARRAVPVASPEGVADTARPTDPEPGDRDDPLWRAVRSLPPKQRLAVVHRVALDRSYADIARALGGSVEAARANVHEGLRRLRKEWT